MKVIARAGDERIAVVYVAEDDAGRRVEFVESVEPPYPRERKWVNILSNLHGCPIRCSFCDAGSRYQGRVSAEGMFDQIDILVRSRYPDRRIPCEKWKIQFARMGEPAFNREVLDVLRQLPDRYDAPGLLPSVSTVAPRGCERFFRELLEVKQALYPEQFQFQFSLHSTDPAQRREMIPAPTWSMAEMAEYGRQIHAGRGRKVTLNFALGRGITVEPKDVRSTFDPEVFLIKLTPMNPTVRAATGGYLDDSDPHERVREVAGRFRDEGYAVIESVGELEENAIGSNCGQYLERIEAEERGERPAESYCYPMTPVDEPHLLGDSQSARQAM